MATKKAVKKNVSSGTSSWSVAKPIPEIEQEFGTGDMNVLKDKLNDIIKILNKY